ncbi:N-acetyl-alpha-D-glucosaminyl L-malate synthase BshA [Actomonas aquatica]|uniref:N-acetyl-alpha-D-glucosaminyl L-malate synthase BshA n=1 Tax=Actomonas aquatica TaxID=2866162 RepID=A0ABZ1CB05_9BACT|nr:N-acetyl-alpha-D-glucosaminyl L-malate synthase BshA [Opitutus sp. WL0086]WRQ88683.1 N-acetyl-alpha-D-glucosaminyl L-malate synthase BshA [Opitutus sp. WL0086]
MDTRPLRIGIICYPSVGGSGILASGLGDELAARGHEVHFISYERPFRLKPGNERVYFHPVEISSYELFKYPDYTLPLSVKLAEVAQTFDLDILHAHYAVPHATAAILARSMLPEGKRPAVVTTLHGTDTTLLGRDPGYAPAIGYALEQSDAVTAVSDFLRRETHRIIGVQREIDVIHNFFDPRPAARSREAVRKELGVKPGQKLVLHLSNLRPVKRIDVMLKALAQVPNRERFKVVVLAGGSFTQHQGLVRQLGLQDTIVLRESVSVVEDYLQAADVGVFTSDSESFCLSILEAANFGCPSVSTRVGGIPEVMEHDCSALLVPAGDSAAVAGALDRLLSDDALREAMGAKARQRARDLFSTERIVPEYEALYRRVLAE